MRILIGLVLLIVSNIGAADTRGTDFAELYAKHSPSVVTVHTVSYTKHKGMTRAAKGLGSGVLIENDQIITAAHVVDGAHAIEVVFTDGERIKAEVISSVEASDVALIKLHSSHPTAPVAVLADSDQTRIGSQVFIIGSPFGISQTLSIGHLSGRMNRGKMADGTPIEFLQTDTAINTGNSGGPMFNTDGEVIGIVSFILTKSGGFDGIGFATAVNSAQAALNSSSGVLAGFEGIMLSEQTASALNFPGSGLLVQRVVADSLIGRAGLQAGSLPAQIGGKSFLLGGDLILEINGSDSNDFELTKTSTLSLNSDNFYKLKVFRNGEVVELLAGNPIVDTVVDNMYSYMQ